MEGALPLPEDEENRWIQSPLVLSGSRLHSILSRGYRPSITPWAPRPFNPSCGFTPPQSGGKNAYPPPTLLLHHPHRRFGAGPRQHGTFTAALEPWLLPHASFWS